MEFSQVKIFVAVAQQKSFSKAAELLFLSQPAVTSNIKKLETGLGVTLFNRKNKNISLTEGGSLFYQYAIEMINVYQKALYSLNGYKKSMSGSLDLTASTIPEQYLLPYMIKEFQTLYPLIKIAIRHQASEKILEQILSGNLNFGFVGAKKETEALEYIDVYNDRLVLIASAENKIASGLVKITDFAGSNIILREDGSGTKLLFENALKKNQLDMSIFGSQIISESLETIKKLVSLDVGISLVPYIAVQDEIKSGQLKQYEIDDLNLQRSYSFVYTKHRTLSPIEEKFKEFLLDWTWN